MTGSVSKKFSSYWVFTRNSIQTLLSYRSNIIFYFIGNVLRIFVFFFLWKAIFKSSGEEILKGFTFPQMVMYLILTTSINETSGSVGGDMSDEIQSGQIAMSFIKPILFRLRIYFSSFGDTLYSFCLSGIPGLIAVYIISFVYGVNQDMNLLNLLFFIISLFLSTLIRMTYNFMYSLLGFVTTNMWGLWQVNKAVTQLCSGAVIPLVFFPKVVTQIFNFLPFASLVSVPLNLFLGKITGVGILYAFGMQLMWILLLTLAGNFVWSKCVKRLTILGG